MKKPILTLLKGNDLYDFSNVIGKKKEINNIIQAQLDINNDRIEKARNKFKNDKNKICTKGAKVKKIIKERKYYE